MWRLAPKGTKLAEAPVDAIRPRTLKIGTRVRVTARLSPQYRVRARSGATSGLKGLFLFPCWKDPLIKRTRCAITTFGFGGHAVRTWEWCCIRYSDGSENHKAAVCPPTTSRMRGSVAPKR